MDLRRDNDRLTVLAAHPETEVNTAHFSATLENALKRLEQQLQSLAARPVPR